MRYYDLNTELKTLRDCVISSIDDRTGLERYVSQLMRLEILKDAMYLYDDITLSTSGKKPVEVLCEDESARYLLDRGVIKL